MQCREGKDMWLIQRGEGRADGEREEGRGVDNGIDSWRGVGNGLDRDRVNVVVDVDQMPACDALGFQVLLLLKETLRWNTTSISGVQQYSSSGTQTSSQQWQ